jgi:hypothetical protein
VGKRTTVSKADDGEEKEEVGVIRFLSFSPSVDLVIAQL